LIMFLDGTNTYAEIKKVLLKLLKNDEEAADIKYKIEELLKALTQMDGLIGLGGKASCSFSKGIDNLIPDIKNYIYPAEKLDRPITITIAFNNTCQCDCIYCYAERERCEQKSLAEWCDIFDEIARNNITLVDIGGADIFARRDAIDILSEMHKRDFYFFVSTKSHLTYEDALKIRALEIGNKNVPEWAMRPIQVSIDSTNNKLASFLTGSKDSFLLAEDTIKNLLKAGLSPRVKAVLTSYNADAPREIVRYFVPLGVEEFHFVQYSRGMYRHKDKLFLTNEQKQELLKIDEELKAEYPGIFISIQKDLTLGGTKNLSWEEWRKRPKCSGGRSKMLLKPNGDVTLCEQTPNTDPFVVGNVFDEGVIGAWNSDKIAEFNYPRREPFKGSVCFNCPEFDLCHETKGYCFRDALCCYGTIYEAPPECPRQTKIPPRTI